MKRLILACVMALALVTSSSANAEICTIDNVPAATLLLPYFEVDLDNPNGVTTLFSIANASASAAVAHVVLWTDLSVPTLDFDVYLTGYDVQTINLRDIFNGIIPVTADDGVDLGDTANPNDGISNQGPLSQDINFPGATGPCAFVIQNPLGNVFITHLRAAHTGQLSPILGGCSAQALGDNIARGYATVDTVTQCSLLFPGDVGYFTAGIADHRNILWGDWIMADQSNPGGAVAIGDAMVHIESALGIPFTGTAVDYPNFVPGDYTFYGRYVAGSAADQREPLPTMHAVRYVDTDDDVNSTDFLVWRDAKVNQGPFPCGTTPAWYPLPANDVVLFDEQENPSVPAACRVSPCLPGSVEFPAETQRTPVANLSPPADSGWAFLNLNTTSTSGLFDGIAQSWVVGVQESSGMAVAIDATQLGTACNSRNIILVP